MIQKDEKGSEKKTTTRTSDMERLETKGLKIL